MLNSVDQQQENIDLMSQKKAETSWRRDKFHDDSLFFFLIMKKTLSNLYLAGKPRSYHLSANNNAWGASVFFMKTA